jgi:phosphatidylglycerophosphatase A
MLWKEFLFTGFYSGYIPVASGTAGTFLAALIFAVEYIIFGNSAIISNLVIILIMIYPSFMLGDASECFFGKKDPSEVVLDEMMGYWISVLFFPFSWKVAIAAFFIFRIIDIIKPYPIKKFEKLNGGLGIMLDDFGAGVYTNLTIRVLLFLLNLAGLNFS